VTRRLCTIAGFCKYTVEKELIEHSPAVHVRRPRMDYESRAVALDRNELDTLQIRRIPVLNGLVNEYTHAA
jgi:integrase/recombinase XerD